MTQAMLLFSLGPVQSFIAQARKTRDLWIGSYLLSLLMEAAMEELPTLIFPATPQVQGDIADLPNKYIALFPDIDAARAAAGRSELRIKQRWLHICRDVWNSVLAQQSTTATRQIWERQTNPEHLFEIFWVIVEGDEQRYAAWLNRTQEALAARKRSRTVRAEETTEAGDEPGEKSTISGIREALRAEDDTREGVRAFWRGIATTFPRDLNQRSGERLDAIDTVKRFAFLADALIQRNAQSATFPSTSSIASASFVRRLFTEHLDATTMRAWLHATRKPLDRMEGDAIPVLERLAGSDPLKKALLQRDGDCYFPTTFTVEHLKKDYAIESLHEATERAQKGGEALDRLLREADEHGIQRPTPYYALFQMDGDRMGRLLGDVSSRQEHSGISAALSTFSRQRVPEIVQAAYPGRLIYAGGDDALALAPLYSGASTSEDAASGPAGATVFSLVEYLQAEYCKTIGQAIEDADRRRAVSASIGIVIAHHYAPLSYVRRTASVAEASAKKEYGRGALVVIVLRRSGEQTKVGCKWEYATWRQGLSVKLRPLALFNEFYLLFKGNALSPNCIYTLLEEAEVLAVLEQNVQWSEVARVLRRHRLSAEDISAQQIEALALRLVELAGVIDASQSDKSMERSSELHEQSPRNGLVEALNWLLVMNFVARKEQD